MRSTSLDAHEDGVVLSERGVGDTCPDETVLVMGWFSTSFGEDLCFWQRFPFVVVYQFKGVFDAFESCETV